ncbi:MAG: hypothetical protein IKK37_03465 [Clostridia bacterium]|nr:hypothetical protein [Clostridia bacterium]
MSLATLKGKVERLIEKVNGIKWFKDNITGVSFWGKSTITSITLDCESFKTLNRAFSACAALNSVYLSNTQNVIAWTGMLQGSGRLRTIETLDFSSADSIEASTWNPQLENLKVVPETIKCNFVCQVRTLTLESAKSILLGLYNYMGTEYEYYYSATLSNEVISLLEADGDTAPGGMTWIDYVFSIGWSM